MGKLIEMQLMRFGRLVVLNREGSYSYEGAAKAAKWLCRCDCGSYTIVLGANLRAGATRSCGCLRNEKASERMKLRCAKSREVCDGEKNKKG